jgi:hypothetical protein
VVQLAGGLNVSAAQRPGGVASNQDRVVLLPDAVILLDGASAWLPQPVGRDGGWYANELGLTIAAELSRQPAEDLTAVLETAIRRVGKNYDLVAGQSPSSTVAIVRWMEKSVDVLVLGDSPVILFPEGGEPYLVTDERLSRIARDQHAVYRAHLGAGGGFDDALRAMLADLQVEQRRWRNKPAGFWIAEANPAAAREAVVVTLPTTNVAALLMSDGVSAGVTDYGVPESWSAARDVVLRQGPAALVEMVHAVEAADPEGRKWPRPKRHDDKTVAFASPHLMEP